MPIIKCVYVCFCLHGFANDLAHAFAASYTHFLTRQFGYQFKPCFSTSFRQTDFTPQILFEILFKILFKYSISIHKQFGNKYCYSMFIVVFDRLKYSESAYALCLHIRHRSIQNNNAQSDRIIPPFVIYYQVFSDRIK